MVNIPIAKKDYDAVYYKETGRKIKESPDIYNQIFISDIDNANDMFFLVYSNFETLEPTVCEKRKDFHIFGLFHGKQILAFEGNFKYIYLVELLDDEVYRQNNQSGLLLGKVKELRKNKFNFEYKDYTEKRKDTFLDLLDLIKADMNGEWGERYAITRYNMKLFSNICKYRGKSFLEYEDKFLYFREEVKKQIKPNNMFRDELRVGLCSVQNMCELSKYIQRNRSRFLDRSDKLYKRNDDVKNSYPINMARRSISLNLYDGLSFNSSLPYYYQYRNYKYATQVLLKVFYESITLSEDKRFEIELKRVQVFYKKQEIIDFQNIDTKLYGLYFPLLMNFRHSIELAYKLILINDELKKKELEDDGIREYVETLDTHDLIYLLERIKPYIELAEFEYLWKLTYFVYYNEAADASFSRYLVDKEFSLDKFRKINIDYVDLQNYVQEFYQVMDGILLRMDLGFNIDNIF